MFAAFNLPARVGSSSGSASNDGSDLSLRLGPFTTKSTSPPPASRTGHPFALGASYDQYGRPPGLYVQRRLLSRNFVDYSSSLRPSATNSEADTEPEGECHAKPYRVNEWFAIHISYARANSQMIAQRAQHFGNLHSPVLRAWSAIKTALIRSLSRT
jgi:hypothetical protein